MALLLNFISFLFFTFLLSSLQINARESQFFSKVTRVNNNDNNNNKYSGSVSQTEFTPETENNYGLYGHESGLHPPTTTTTVAAATTNPTPYTSTDTYHTYKTESEDAKNNYYNTNQNELSDTRLAGSSYSSNNYNKDAYESKQSELSDTKYMEGEDKSMENQNNNQRYYNNNNNNNAANERYNGERQGLSDTRFMEGGKYFYDAANSERHNPTLNGGSSRGINPENLYNNKGYIGKNNANSYENKKYSMEGYQNQEEFEDDQDNFEVEP
ncbi:PREDICTED: protein E6-like isoform X5 [Lupinus angustifolius]|uniref:protein E6-like isoform X5 n=1 Tax=Lupinus angustifolius TaxID=3871 RepID=UPI00092FA0DE|nr:PREDICTED: protein E6-like isoform X5 [Lupinus angustifolius]